MDKKQAVKKIVYYNRHNRPPRQREMNDGTTMVDIAGYVPAKEKIESMFAAGERLRMAREQAFDIPPGADVDEDSLDPDPTRRPGYDLADASADIDRLERKARTRKPVKEPKKEKATSESSVEPTEDKKEEGKPSS